MTSQLHPVNIKVNVVGDQSVGKTSIIHRFAYNRFNENYLPTLGFEISIKNLLIDNVPVIFSIWDMGGQQCFDPVRSRYYQESKGFLLVFNLALRVTIRNLENWIVDIKQTCPNASFVVVANKSDIPIPTCTNAEIEQRVNELGAIGYVKTSAKTGEGVENAFVMLGKSIFQRVKNPVIVKPS